jgi:DNA-binding PadR family transcriptional regulator
MVVAKGRSNPLALAVLTLLSEEPMHPYQMSATLKERRKEDSIKINYGSLYSVVESLTKRGLIEAREIVREGNRPERTIYAITDQGEREMVDWLSGLLSTPVKEFPQFEAALSLMPALSPDEVIGLLEQRLESVRAEHEAAVTLMAKAQDAGMPRLFAIEHEYEVALMATQVEFLTELVNDLRNGDFSGLAGWRRHAELRSQGKTTAEIWAIMREEFKEDFTWVERLQNMDI